MADFSSAAGRLVACALGLSPGLASGLVREKAEYSRRLKDIWKGGKRWEPRKWLWVGHLQQCYFEKSPHAKTSLGSLCLSVTS